MIMYLMKFDFLEIDWFVVFQTLHQTRRILSFDVIVHDIFQKYDLTETKIQ